MPTAASATQPASASEPAQPHLPLSAPVAHHKKPAASLPPSLSGAPTMDEASLGERFPKRQRHLTARAASSAELWASSSGGGANNNNASLLLKQTQYDRDVATLVKHKLVHKGEVLRCKDDFNRLTVTGEVCPTGQRILCGCGCQGIYSATRFAVHGGLSQPHTINRALSHIQTCDGSTLAELSTALTTSQRESAQQPTQAPPPPAAAAEAGYNAMQTAATFDYSDDVCRICSDGGELLCCEACPATFHIECLGLKSIPEGDWFCEACRCGICGQSNYQRDGFSDEVMLLCDQCEREFHIGCLNAQCGQPNLAPYGQGQRITALPEGTWFCSPQCTDINRGLDAMCATGLQTLEIPCSSSAAGTSSSSSRTKVTYRLLHGLHERHDGDAKRLQAALDLMREGFNPIIEPRTGQDLVPRIVSAAAPENTGFRTLCVYVGRELVSAACIRVFGTMAAELPLVATKYAHRGKGLCRITVHIIETMLLELGVNKLILPSVETAMLVWGALGFEACVGEDRRRICGIGTLVFPGTSVLQRYVRADSLTTLPKDVALCK
ncbi:PHD-type domain-containing protein [Pycnococcus provasolii]